MKRFMLEMYKTCVIYVKITLNLYCINMFFVLIGTYLLQASPGVCQQLLQQSLPNLHLPQVNIITNVSMPSTQPTKQQNQSGNFY